MRQWETAVGETVTVKGLFAPKMTCTGCRKYRDLTYVDDPAGEAASHAATCRELSRKRRREQHRT